MQTLPDEDPRKQIGLVSAYPQTPADERFFQKYFLNETGTALPNEANNVTLLTLQNLYKDNADATTLAAIQSCADAENKYLVNAMKILTGELGAYAGPELAGVERLRQKFGTDATGAIYLAHLLKQRETELRYHRILDPVIQKITTDPLGAILKQA